MNQRKEKTKNTNALVCSACKKVIKVGTLFTVEETRNASGEKVLKAQYCKNCKK